MLGTYVSTEHYDRWLGRARQAAEPVSIQFESDVMENQYNRKPFLVRHALASHPAFKLESLFSLCRRLPEAAVQYRSGTVPKDAHFDSSLAKYRPKLPLSQILDDFEGQQAYIAIYNPEQDAAYNAVIEGLMSEIAMATSPFEHCINWYSTYIFISAQNSLTPYHMDREMNFLLQIRGTKLVRLWDPNDDRVMSPAERDYLFSFNNDARPTYRPDLDALANDFNLSPGLGVHHPFIAPHLVHTGPELSISLAITFRTPRSDKWSDAHVFNQRFLRRLGVPAGRVGRYEHVDGLKAGLLHTLRGARKIMPSIMRKHN